MRGFVTKKNTYPPDSRESTFDVIKREDNRWLSDLRAKDRREWSGRIIDEDVCPCYGDDYRKSSQLVDARSSLISIRRMHVAIRVGTLK